MPLLGLDHAMVSVQKRYMRRIDEIDGGTGRVSADLASVCARSVDRNSDDSLKLTHKNSIAYSCVAFTLTVLLFLRSDLRQLELSYIVF